MGCENPTWFLTDAPLREDIPLWRKRTLPHLVPTDGDRIYTFGHICFASQDRKLQSSTTSVMIVLEKVETKVLKICEITRIYIISTKMHFMALVSGLGLCFTKPSDLISDL